jgi:phosphatidate cytidylyltransferase
VNESGPTRPPVTDEAAPSRPLHEAEDASKNLATRAVSGVVLAGIAVAAALFGGWPFVLFWAGAAIGVFWEWAAMVTGGAVAVMAAGIVTLLAVMAAAGSGQFGAALAALAAGSVAVALSCPPQRRAWGAGGVLYAGTVLLAPVVLRQDSELGRVAILFLFATVWATDIFGYFAGRALGGPKLAHHISPNKTWSGACGGALGAVAAGVVFMRIAGNAGLISSACVALALSIVSQGGDLFESVVKRRFGVKDASHIIPGHGGLMDRLDGFLAAAGVAALVGLARGGTEASARGLILW